MAQQYFEHSLAAQLNWTGLKSFYDTNILKFPTTIPTIDDKAYSLTSDKAAAFFLGMFAFIRSCVTSGMEEKAKLSLLSATLEIYNFVDERTQTGYQLDTTQTGN